MSLTLPIDFVAARKAIAMEFQRVTGTTCVLEEPTYQGATRPALPYCSFKFITPAMKSGDDGLEPPVSGTVWNRGGQRKISVSFHVYALDQEQAYNLMCLWQASLQQVFVRSRLLQTGNLAVWLIGNVADVSQLVNTGYEARAQMDVTMGIAANLSEDLGQIDTVRITGTILTEDGTAAVEEFTVP